MDEMAAHYPTVAVTARDFVQTPGRRETEAHHFVDIGTDRLVVHNPEPMSWAGFMEILSNHWGNFASVLGLAVSVATLAVATKARQAAEAAKAAARRQSLTETLQDTVRKSEQVGLFLSQQKWDIVWLRAQEVTSEISLMLTRWSEELGGGSRDNLLRCQRLSRSISGVALTSSSNPPTAPQVAQMSQAQGRVAQLLSAELGEALRSVEGSR